MRQVPSLLLALLILTQATAATLEISEPVVMRGAAVAETPDGLVGSTATFTITAARNGSGHVFLDTFPLTQVDMQGSARLAARVASQVTGKDLATQDLFFVIRSNSVTIGGPSAGATLTVGAIAAMNGWKVDDDVLMTGTISPDGTVGPVGGVPEKAAAAARAGMRLFLYPAGEDMVQISGPGGRVVDMPEYCRAELGIECRPVGDMFDAVENMTDHALVRPVITGNVTGEAFQAKLGPLSGLLLDIARERVREADERIAALPPGAARTSLEALGADARLKLARAESAVANGTYYTASSLSFQASIAGRDARDRARIVANDTTLAGILDEASEDVARANRTVREARVADAGSFEYVGAAQVRLVEAEQRIAAARALALTDASRAIAEAAFAGERAETAMWWLELGEETNGGAPVDPEGLEEVARDTITSSLEVVAYVEAVFQAQAGPGFLSTANARLADAESSMDRGFHAAAILFALEAQVRASDVLLLASFQGDVPEARLEAARVSAALAIQAARARGVEPTLAESEYEFALSLTDPAERLSFLGISRVTANLAGLPGFFGAARQATESRFQGIVEPPEAPASWVAAGFAVGLALGAGLGLTAMLPGQRRQRPPEN